MDPKEQGQVPTTPTPGASAPPPSVPEIVAAPGAPANPEPPATVEPKTFDADYVKKLRDEAAAARVTNKSLQDKLDEINRAKMSEQERLQADLAKASADRDAFQRQIRELQVQVTAGRLGIVDPEAASKLLDWGQVDAGQSVETALQALLAAKPYLKPTAAPAAPAVPQVPPQAVPSQSSPAAPAGSAVPPAFTKSQLERMPQAQMFAEMDEIKKAMAEGRVDYSR